MKQIHSIITIILIKLKILAQRPVVIFLCLILPVLLNLLAGATIDRNNAMILEGAYVDEADNETSAKLIDLLDQAVVDWYEMSREEAERALQLGQVDGVFIIPEDFGRIDERNLKDVFSVKFLIKEENIASGLLMENFLVSVVVLYVEAQQQLVLLNMPEALNYSEEEILSLLRENVEAAKEGGAGLHFEFYGDPGRDGEERVIAIPDYSIEVLFLSVFSLIGSLMLADVDTRRRILSVAGGPGKDYIATIFTLMISGLVQLLTMNGILRLLMPEMYRPEGYYLIMILLLLMMIAFGQCIALIPLENRVMPASIILFVSISLGGSLIKLPDFWYAGAGQYIPHGWVMGKLLGLPSLISPVAMLIIILAILLTAFYLQVNRQALN